VLGRIVREEDDDLLVDVRDAPETGEAGREAGYP
jgi:hypothetical protein